MKKIIFCLQTMVCGGVEKELITILRKFDPHEYDLTVLLFYEQDADIQSSIPAHVKVDVLHIDRAYYCAGTRALVAGRLKKGRVGEAVRIAAGRLLKGIPAAASMDLSRLPDLPGSFDYAVCYHMHAPVMLRFVAEHIRASKKIAWIHNDFATTRYRIDAYSRWLEQYDRIIGVSAQLTDEFKARCPRLADRARTVHNIVDVEDIRIKSADLTEVDEAFQAETRFRIVTVGRFVEQKGFDLAIRAAKKLKDQGIAFCWFAIGYGAEEDRMRALIRELGVEDVFAILGRKDNPYPYMAMADIYVQPSRHEGYAITVEEVRALRKPILCTNFAGAPEQVRDGINGYVIRTCSAEAIAEALSAYIRSAQRQETLRSSLKASDLEDGWLQIKEIFDT